MRKYLSILFSKYRLQLILFVTLVNGMVYLALVPPWQHYDEPGHFEYAWLVANLDHWPLSGEYDQYMRREVAASMIEHDFYRGLTGLPNLLEIKKPVEIGIAQTGDLPIYYFLASLPLRILKYTDITLQLYSARLVSVLLFVLTICMAYLTCSLLFGDDHPLSWMIPLFMAFLPALVDLMSAVNNDVAAIAFFTLFVYAAVRLNKKGVNLFNLGLLFAAMVLCMFTKSTAWLALPLGGLSLIMALFKKKWLWVYILLGFLAIIMGGYVLMDWKQPAPALFYASSDSVVPRAIKSENAPVGENIFIQTGQTYSSQGFYHFLDPNTFQEHLGKSVTLGFWIWADQPTMLHPPVLELEGQTIRFREENLEVTEQPEFFVLTTQLPEKGLRLWLRTFAIKDKDNRLYWDGFFLAPGDLSDMPGIPQYLDINGDTILWGGTTHTNLIRNGSAERIWPLLSSKLSQVLGSQINVSTTHIWSIFDLDANGWYYRSALTHMFRSFWAIFGWSHVLLVGGKPYRFLFMVSILSLIGMVYSMFTSKDKLDGRILLLFLTMTLFQLTVVVMRGAGSWFNYTMLPAARYFFPVVLPVVIFLVSGWYVVFKILFDIIRIPAKIQALFYILSLVMLEIWALYSIYQFY
jgi:hypothetical protein